mgnify:CR=1 FL=1
MANVLVQNRVSTATPKLPEEVKRQGIEVTVFSLKLPREGRFHEKLARVQAEVVYVPDRGPADLLRHLAERRAELSSRRDLVLDLLWEELGTGAPDARALGKAVEEFHGEGLLFEGAFLPLDLGAGGFTGPRLLPPAALGAVRIKPRWARPDLVTITTGQCHLCILRDHAHGLPVSA